MKENIKRELICISCPIGCLLTVESDENGKLTVSGNACKRGETYGIKEVTAPVRTVTSTIRVTGGKKPLVPVRTKTEIPKDMISACMQAIHETKIAAPVSIGDVLITNAAGTGTDIVAAGNVDKA